MKRRKQRRDRDIRLVRELWNWMCRNRQLVLLWMLAGLLAATVGGRIRQEEISDARAQGRAAGIAAEQLRVKETARLAAEGPFADGAAQEQVRREAEEIAKVLYAVRDNSRAGQKLAVWCVIERCRSPLYPDMAEKVCRQTGQWMGYGEDNPILSELYETAWEELVYWHNGGYLPAAEGCVYLEWTPEQITLRDSFDGSGSCHYFYESDWEAFNASRAARDA